MDVYVAFKGYNLSPKCNYRYDIKYFYAKTSAVKYTIYLVMVMIIWTIIWLSVISFDVTISIVISCNLFVS